MLICLGVRPTHLHQYFKNKGRLVLSGEYGTLLNGLEKPGQVDIENSFFKNNK